MIAPTWINAPNRDPVTATMRPTFSVDTEIRTTGSRAAMAIAVRIALEFCNTTAEQTPHVMMMMVIFASRKDGDELVRRS